MNRKYIPIGHADWIFTKKYGLSFYNDKMAHQRVKTAAEKTKMELSSKETAHFYVKELMSEFGPYADVDHKITRGQFESMVEDLVDHTVETFKNTLADVELDKDEIDNVILVGGMTRLPLVRKKIEEFLGRPADISVNPDEAVAIGAAVQAGVNDEQLTEARTLVRHSQFRWDYISASNGMGFHSPQESMRLLGDSLNQAQEARLIVARLLAGRGIIKQPVYPDYQTRENAWKVVQSFTGQSEEKINLLP